MAKRGMTPERAERLLVEKSGSRGTRIRMLRVERGLTQREFAKITGMSLSTIRFFEQNKGGVDRSNLETLCLLCEALGCTIGDIIDCAELSRRYKEVR